MTDYAHEIRRFKTLSLDICCKAVEIGAVRKRLTSSEFAIMDMLTRRPGVLFSRAQLMDAMYGIDAGYYTDRTVDSHIKRIRKQGVSGIISHYRSGITFKPWLTISVSDFIRA